MREELKLAGPAFFIDIPYIIHVGGSDDEAIPALEVMVQHEVPQILHFLGKSGITDRSMRVVGEMKWLRELILINTGVTDEGLKSLRGLSELETIHLSGTLITDEGIVELATLPKLRRITVEGTDVTLFGLEALVEQSPSLEGLEIAELRFSTTLDSDDHDAEPVLRRLVGRKLPTEKMGLRGTGFTDKSLGIVGQMTWLRELSLTETSISDDGLVHLRNLKMLQTLRLDNTGITDAGLDYLVDLPALSFLAIDDSKITLKGLTRLMERSPSLQNEAMQEYLSLLRQKRQAT